jgi:hypothetical protein
MYTLLIKAPCRVPSTETVKYYYVGDVVNIEDSDYEFFELNYQAYYELMGYTDTKQVSKVIKTEPVKTIKEYSNEPTVITVSHTADVPLPADASAQDIKAYLLQLEEAIPIDLKAVASVRVKFTNYPSVVKQCERILNANNVTLKY